MEQRSLKLGRWELEFYFADDGYDVDLLVDRLFDFGASPKLMRQAMALMESGRMNTGFTYTNEVERLALVAIGPTTDGDEFIDTLVHELHHVAVAIALDLGISLDDERPAYISGDSARMLASTICRLGCQSCRNAH